jgi:hypothetical protein
MEYLQGGRDEKLDKTVNTYYWDQKVLEDKMNGVREAYVKQEIVGQTNFLLSLCYNFNNKHTKNFSVCVTMSTNKPNFRRCSVGITEERDL